jgi:C_GCAxxG_C_C family probable redox protein
MILQSNTKSETINKAQSYFDEGYACSQSILLAFTERFDLDERTAKLISSTFGGGMGRLRQTCGAVTGGFMVLGLAYGNIEPNDMTAKLFAYQKVRELYHQVEEIHGTVNCKELLQKHSTQAQVEERKHHKIICRRLVSEVAGLMYEMLEQNNIQ